MAVASRVWVRPVEGFPNLHQTIQDPGLPSVSGSCVSSSAPCAFTKPLLPHRTRVQHPPFCLGKMWFGIEESGEPTSFWHSHSREDGDTCHPLGWSPLAHLPAGGAVQSPLPELTGIKTKLHRKTSPCSPPHPHFSGTWPPGKGWPRIRALVCYF